MSLDKLIYSGWQAPVRVVVVGTLAYVALLVLLRVSGKRTLSKMNAFDSIVTIALGSTLASALITRDVAFVQAVTAFALLIGLQLIVTWLSVRFETVDRLVKAEPTLLLYRGRLLSDSLRRERVTEGEVLAAIREHGGESIEATEAVVIETTGTLSVIPRLDATASGASSASSALAPVWKQPAEDDASAHVGKTTSSDGPGGQRA